MATLKDSYTTGETNDAFVSNPAHFLGQTFTASSAYQLYSVKFKLWRTGSPGNTELHVRATSAGLPTGADLAVSGTFDANTLGGTPGALTEFVLSTPINLTNGVQYAIFLSGGSTTDASNYINFRYDLTGAYAGGDIVRNLGSWGGLAGYDMMFETYGDPVVTFQPKIIIIG